MLTATRPAVGARPAIEVDLEDLVVWTIRDQKADRADIALHDIEAGVSLYGEPVRAADVRQGRSADGTATIARNAAVGCPIDGGGALRGVSATVHPDAELVADAIDRLRPARRRLVLHHGRKGERPDWSAGHQVLERVRVPDDQPGSLRHRVTGEWEPTATRPEVARYYIAAGLGLFDAHGRKRLDLEERGFRYRYVGGRREVLVRCCPLELSPSDDWIAMVNGMYAMWHAGMTQLLELLQRAPLRHRAITGFAAPARPWNLGRSDAETIKRSYRKVRTWPLTPRSIP